MTRCDATLRHDVIGDGCVVHSCTLHCVCGGWRLAKARGKACGRHAVGLPRPMPRKSSILPVRPYRSTWTGAPKGGFDSEPSEEVVQLRARSVLAARHGSRTPQVGAVPRLRTAGRPEAYTAHSLLHSY